jgi:hypothetical protein
MKKHFFIKLIAPRPTFSDDMTEEERIIMNNHVVYWKNLLEKKIAILFGPVFDPKGGYGIGVIAVDDEEEIKNIIDNDPAKIFCIHEYYFMRAVF